MRITEKIAHSSRSIMKSDQLFVQLLACDRCGKRGDSMFGLFSPAEDKLFWSCIDCLEKSEARRLFWRKSDLARLREKP
jgi:hypothetical protein